MATVVDVPSSLSDAGQSAALHEADTRTDQSPSPDTHVTTTIYSFPKMEPLHFAYYPHSYLYLPLRKDILHKAVIFEGDAARKGLASTKHRTEVHGSGKKIRPQKGTGRARAGDKQSPIFKGGGVVFGPKPRDFSTGLNKKIYDLAWRTALSYRYRKGELIVVDRMRNFGDAQEWYLKQMFRKYGWGNEAKRSLMVTSARQGRAELFKAMEHLRQHGRIAEVDDVDVKDLLGMGRIVIEKAALDSIMKHHSSDIPRAFGMASSDLPLYTGSASL